MCNFDILSHNEHGYLARCSGCGYYQLGFGTMVITFTTRQLNSFYRRLYEEQNQVAGEQFHSLKTIRMCVHASHIRMALSLIEIEILIKLFDEALATISFRKLMEELQID